jgi:transcriptional regulator with XRE-family HTH domain
VNLKKRRYVRSELDRLMFEVLHGIRDQSAEAVARRCGLAPRTISKMRSKTTRYPQAATLVAIARAGGLTITTAPAAVVEQAPRRSRVAKHELRAN